MARFLVTGGAGFIGSHLADHLIAGGHAVTALDDLSTGSETNLRHLHRHCRFRLVVASTRDARTVSSLAGDADAIFHLAASVGVEHTVEHPAYTIENNIVGTHTVLDAAARHGRPVLLTSSSEVYGPSAPIPHHEDAELRLGSPRWSRWAYAGSKACEEYFALSLHREQRVNVVVVRLFNVAGPRQSAQHGMVIPRFAAQALSGAPITVHGSGQQRRCFLDVRDAVAALTKIMQTPVCFGEIINIGSEEEISIRDLAQLIRSIACSVSEIVHVSEALVAGRGQTHDAQRRIPSLEKVRRLVGWKATYTCHDSIVSVIEHLKDTAEYREAIVSSVA